MFIVWRSYRYLDWSVRDVVFLIPRNATMTITISTFTKTKIVLNNAQRTWMGFGFSKIKILNLVLNI